MTIYHEDLSRLTNKDKSTYQRKKKKKKGHKSFRCKSLVTSYYLFLGRHRFITKVNIRIF